MIFFKNSRTFNNSFVSNPRFKHCSDEEKLLNFYVYIQFEINNLILINNFTKK